MTDSNGDNLSSNGTVTLVNVYSPDYVNDILGRDNYSGGSFSSRVYFTHDANYDVTAVINTSGTVLQREVYDAYGNMTFYHGDWTVHSDDEEALQFAYQGMVYSPVIGWYFSGQSNFGRWYSPTMITWDRPDEGYIDSMSLYQFVDGNPASFTDPTGLAPDDPLSIDGSLEIAVEDVARGNGSIQDLIDEFGITGSQAAKLVAATILRSGRRRS